MGGGDDDRRSTMWRGLNLKFKRRNDLDSATDEPNEAITFRLVGATIAYTRDRRSIRVNVDAC